MGSYTSIYNTLFCIIPKCHGRDSPIPEKYMAVLMLLWSKHIIILYRRSILERVQWVWPVLYLQRAVSLSLLLYHIFPAWTELYSNLVHSNETLRQTLALSHDLNYVALMRDIQSGPRTCGYRFIFTSGILRECVSRALWHWVGRSVYDSLCGLIHNVVSSDAGLQYKLHKFFYRHNFNATFS